MRHIAPRAWRLVAVLALVSFLGCPRDGGPPPPPPPPTNENPDSGAQSSDAGRDAGAADAGRGAVDAGPDAGLVDPDAGQPDAGEVIDAGTDELDAGAIDAGIILPTAGLVYSGDRTLSPIDATLAQHLRAITARGTGRPDVFSKVGDSISTNMSGVSGGTFLNCFDGFMEGTVSWEINVRMGAYSSLVPTIDYFKVTHIGVDDSWTRVSLATRVSMTAHWAITGSPSPLEQELSAAMPRYAVVMYGSNDIGYGGTPYPVADMAEIYDRNMRTLTDQILAKGVIPLLTTMPPDRDFFRYVPVFSGVVRAIAQGRQVPLIDFYKELMAVGPPAYGLRSDGTHPACRAFNTCCHFDPASLSQYGVNVRNLITLQSLDRMHQIFELGAPALDPQAPRLAGDGSPSSPFVISQVPYGELRDLRTSTTLATGALSCAGAPAVSGPQNLYRLVLTRTTSLRALALDGGLRAQRLSLLSGPSLSTCMKTDQRFVAATLPAGTYYFAVNAQAATGGAEYNFSVTECIPGDAECQ